MGLPDAPGFRYDAAARAGQLDFLGSVGAACRAAPAGRWDWGWGGDPNCDRNKPGAGITTFTAEEATKADHTKRRQSRNQPECDKTYSFHDGSRKT